VRGERREDATTAEPKAEEGTEYEREAGSSSHPPTLELRQEQRGEIE